MKSNQYSKSNVEPPYKYVDNKDLIKLFKINGRELSLKSRKTKPIKINIPFKIDENIAKISAMLLDGALNKNLHSIQFCQKKDKSKVTEFSKIIKSLFKLESKFRMFNNNSPGLTVHSKVLGTFFHKCLGISKSDEITRIPYWIWESPKSVILEYLRYAFAMEGSISEYLKGPEVKFHSVDKPYLIELKRLLKIKFKINSYIQKYYISKYGWKYYLNITNEKEILKFQEIGFALKSHQVRLNNLVSSFKNKAWEITLVSILKLGKNNFVIRNVNKLFPYLVKRTIHHRLSELIRLGYLKKEKKGYSITKKGLRTALSIKDKVKITNLRTYARENEASVLKFLTLKKKSYRNEISRMLSIDSTTIHDTLKRLENQNKIQMTEVDKFQRKFYEIV